MKKNYTPRPDSVPARLITLLHAHPGGVLNSTEAAHALDVESKNLPALVSRAVEVGLIVRGKNDAGMNTFRLPGKGGQSEGIQPLANVGGHTGVHSPNAGDDLVIDHYPDGDISFTGAGVSEAGDVILTPKQQRQLVRRLCLPLIQLEGL